MIGMRSKYETQIKQAAPIPSIEGVIAVNAACKGKTDNMH